MKRSNLFINQIVVGHNPLLVSPVGSGQTPFHETPTRQQLGSETEEESCDDIISVEQTEPSPISKTNNSLLDTANTPADVEPVSSNELSEIDERIEQSSGDSGNNDDREDTSSINRNETGENGSSQQIPNITGASTKLETTTKTARPSLSLRCDTSPLKKAPSFNGPKDMSGTPTSQASPSKTTMNTRIASSLNKERHMMISSGAYKVSDICSARRNKRLLALKNLRSSLDRVVNTGAATPTSLASALAQSSSFTPSAANRSFRLTPEKLRQQSSQSPAIDGRDETAGRLEMTEKREGTDTLVDKPLSTPTQSIEAAKKEPQLSVYEVQARAKNVSDQRAAVMAAHQLIQQQSRLIKELKNTNFGNSNENELAKVQQRLVQVQINRAHEEWQWREQTTKTNASYNNQIAALQTELEKTKALVDEEKKNNETKMVLMKQELKQRSLSLAAAQQEILFLKNRLQQESEAAKAKWTAAVRRRSPSPQKIRSVSPKHRDISPHTMSKISGGKILQESQNVETLPTTPRTKNSSKPTSGSRKASKILMMIKPPRAAPPPPPPPPPRKTKSKKKKDRSGKSSSRKAKGSLSQAEQDEIAKKQKKAQRRFTWGQFLANEISSST